MSVHLRFKVDDRYLGKTYQGTGSVKGTLSVAEDSDLSIPSNMQLDSANSSIRVDGESYSTKTSIQIGSYLSTGVASTTGTGVTYKITSASISNIRSLLSEGSKSNVSFNFSQSGSMTTTFIFRSSDGKDTVEIWMNFKETGGSDPGGGDDPGGEDITTKPVIAIAAPEYVSDSTFILRWDPASGAAGYNIYKMPSTATVDTSLSEAIETIQIRPSRDEYGGEYWPSELLTGGIFRRSVNSPAVSSDPNERIGESCKYLVASMNPKTGAPIYTEQSFSNSVTRRLRCSSPKVISVDKSGFVNLGDTVTFSWDSSSITNYHASWISRFELRPIVGTQVFATISIPDMTSSGVWSVSEAVRTDEYKIVAVDFLDGKYSDVDEGTRVSLRLTGSIKLSTPIVTESNYSESYIKEPTAAQAQLRWFRISYVSSTTGSNYVAGYRIFTSDTEDGEYTLVAEIPPDDGSYSSAFGYLYYTVSRSYYRDTYFKVQAIGSILDSDLSNALKVNKLSDPAAVKLTAIPSVHGAEVIMRDSSIGPQINFRTIMPTDTSDIADLVAEVKETNGVIFSSDWTEAKHISALESNPIEYPYYQVHKLFIALRIKFVSKYGRSQGTTDFDSDWYYYPYVIGIKEYYHYYYGSFSRRTSTTKSRCLLLEDAELFDYDYLPDIIAHKTQIKAEHIEKFKTVVSNIHSKIKQGIREPDSWAQFEFPVTGDQIGDNWWLSLLNLFQALQDCGVTHQFDQLKVDLMNGLARSTWPQASVLNELKQVLMDCTLDAIWYIKKS